MADNAALLENPSNQLLGSSITYRIAVGPQQGRKVFTLQTLPDCESDNPFASTFIPYAQNSGNTAFVLPILCLGILFI